MPIISRRRSKASEITPAGKASSITGRALAAATSDTMVAAPGS
jgi:hypothetical protein